MNNSGKKIDKYRPTTIGYPIAILSFLVGIIGLLLSTSLFDFSLNISTAIIIIISLIIIFLLLIKIDKTNELNNFLKIQISQGTQGLLLHYAELGKYKLTERYKDFFNKFTNNEGRVLGVQTYTYSLFSEDKSFSVKLTHEDGYVREGIDLNAIIQEYYEFNKEDLQELKTALFDMEINNNVDGILNFIIRIDKDTKASSLNNERIILLEYAYNIVKERFNIDIPSIENKEKLVKRSGIVTSVLNYEYFNEASNFLFSYDGLDRHKKERYYLTFTVKSTTGEKRLYLIIYKVGQIHTNDDIIEIGNHLALSFKKSLKANNLVDETHSMNYDNKRGLIENVRKKINEII